MAMTTMVAMMTMMIMMTMMTIILWIISYHFEGNFGIGGFMILTIGIRWIRGFLIGSGTVKNNWSFFSKF